MENDLITYKCDSCGTVWDIKESHPILIIEENGNVLRLCTWQCVHDYASEFDIY